MPTHIKFNITVKTGSYTDKEGNTKGKYKTVGQVMEKDDNSKFLLIDPHFNFAAVKREEGREMVICSLMEPKKDEAKQASNTNEGNQWNAEE